MKKIFLFLGILFIMLSCNQRPILIEDSNIYGGLSYQSNVNGEGFKLSVVPNVFTTVGSKDLKGFTQGTVLNLEKGLIIYDDSIASVCVVGFNCSISSPNNNCVFLGTIYKNSLPVEISSREDEESYNKAIGISSMGIVYLKAGDTISMRVQLPTGGNHCSIKNFNLTLYKIK